MAAAEPSVCTTLLALDFLVCQSFFQVTGGQILYVPMKLRSRLVFSEKFSIDADNKGLFIHDPID